MHPKCQKQQYLEDETVFILVRTLQQNVHKCQRLEKHATWCSGAEGNERQM